MTTGVDDTHDIAPERSANEPAVEHLAEHSSDHSVDGTADAAQGPTPAQLRRFIKSRPYVPMHELRRRFELSGDLDDVTAVQLHDGRVFVGLPAREAEFLAGLVRDGDVGLELATDPAVPIVVGVFPMKPVTRG